jgi:hypothetical protein
MDATIGPHRKAFFIDVQNCFIKYAVISVFVLRHFKAQVEV